MGAAESKPAEFSFTVPASLWNNAVKIGPMEKIRSFFKDYRIFLLSSDHKLYWFLAEKSLTALNYIEMDLCEFEKVGDTEFILTRRRTVEEGGDRIYKFRCSSAREREEWWEAKKRIDWQVDQIKRGKGIKRSDIQLSEKKIGEGASGSISVGKWGGTDIAVKTLKNSFSDEERREFQAEIEILSELNHPGIVRMYGWSLEGNNLLLVTELVKAGDLKNIIRNKQKYPTLSEKSILNVCCSIGYAMNYLHSKNVIHRDLKPGNILVKDFEKGEINICDFGLTAISTGTHGTPLYAAPDLIERDHTSKVDVFSFAVIVWELYAREEPFPGLFPRQIEDKIKEGERPEIPNNCNQEEMIKKMWQKDPNNRPDFSNICSYFSGCLQATSQNDSDGLSLENMMQHFEGEQMEWDKVASIFQSKFSVKRITVERLGKVLLVDGIVHRQNFSDFFSRFCPIYEEGKIWNFTEIGKLVYPSYFVNANASETSKMLDKDGTFLFRFSGKSEAVVITLSARYNHQIHHMRIGVDEVDGKVVYTPTCGIAFKSLDEVVKHYRENPWKLKSGESFFLGMPYVPLVAEYYTVIPDAEKPRGIVDPIVANGSGSINDKNEEGSEIQEETLAI